MLAIREEPDYVIVTAAGKLTREDYDRFIPEFERIAQQRGKVSMLIEATTFTGWDIGGLWQDLKFDVTHQSALGPIAIIGDRAWEEWAVKFAKPFFRPAMRFFRPYETEAARRWLMQGDSGEKQNVA